MKKIVILSLLTLISSPAFADWTKLKAEDFYLKNPPANNSAETKKEIQILHRLEHTRSDAECALARVQVIPSYEKIFSGAPLSQEEIKRAAEFTQKVMLFSYEAIIKPMKEKFDRPRPYEADPTLNPCVEKPKGSQSYPSGHATAGALGSCILQQIYPKKAAELTKYGKLAGQLRVLGGVHHPSDIKAGEILALDICKALLKDSDFQAEIAKLK